MSKRWIVFFLFSVAYFMSYFYRSANAVIAPDLSAELSLNAAQLGFMTSLFFAAFAAVQIPLGVGLDRWGPRWVTPVLMLAGVAGSLIFASSHSFATLALGRALIGVGMAGILMGSLKMFSQWFPANRFATASGLLIGIGSLGALLAATPLAWLNNAMGWRTVFVAGALATALIAGAIMMWTRNVPPGVEWPRTDTTLRGTGSEIAGVFRDARFWRIAPLTFFLAGTLLGFQGLWSGPYLFDVYGLSDIQVGNVLIWLAVGATVGYTISGWLCDRFGMSRTITLASALFICVQAALAMQPPLFAVPILYLLFGLTGGFNTMLLAQTRMVFPLAMTGKAVTAVNVFAIGGTFVLQWWMGLVIGLFPTDAAGAYPAAAYSVALILTATGALLALLWYRPLAKISTASEIAH